MEIVWIHSTLSEVSSLRLLKSAMHAVKERPSDKGNLVDDKESDVGPLALKVLELVPFKLLGERRMRIDAESRARRLSAEANVEGGNARVCRKLDGRIHLLSLKEESQVLKHRLQRGGFTAARRAAQVRPQQWRALHIPLVLRLLVLFVHGDESAAPREYAIGKDALDGVKSIQRIISFDSILVDTGCVSRFPGRALGELASYRFPIQAEVYIRSI